MTRSQHQDDLKSVKRAGFHDYVSLDPNRSLACTPIEKDRIGDVTGLGIMPLVSDPWLMADTAEAGWPCFALLKYANAVAFHSMVESGSIMAGEANAALLDAPDGLELEAESFQSRLDAGYFVL